MKSFFVLLLLAVTNSCSEKNTGEQESSQISTNENTDEILIPISENPSEITLIVTVLESFDSKMDICGQEKDNIVSIRVDEIGSYGQGVVNLPLKNQELLVRFLVLNEKLTENSTLELTAKESLCSNASETYLSVLRHKILE